MPNKPTFIFFHAPAWCRPCHTMLPIVEQLSEDLQETVTYADIDVPEFRDMASRMAVRSVPTLVKLDTNGNPVDYVIGIASVQTIQAFMS